MNYRVDKNAKEYASMGEIWAGFRESMRMYSDHV